MTWLNRLVRRIRRTRRRAYFDRRQVVLRTINPHGKGLEIGPCHRPIAPKAAGFDVRIMDHCTRNDLMKKYQGASDVDPRVIEEVDYVWQGQSFGSLVGSNTKFDWIIASHVIEHTPDFVGFLQQCESILAHDGALALVVPDKRFCFDRYRPLAGLASILDAHSEKRLRHTPGVAADYYLNVVRRGGTIAWDAAHRGACVSLHDVSDALQGIQTLQQPGLYLDLHAWCFTPSWFRVIMHDLHVLGLIGLRESFFNETQGHEFFMTLRRDGPGPNVARLDLLERSLAELAVGAA